jgi:hypothetical protein
LLQFRRFGTLPGIIVGQIRKLHRPAEGLPGPHAAPHRRPARPRRVRQAADPERGRRQGFRRGRTDAADRRGAIRTGRFRR